MTAWPADGLESVPACPACGDAGRELLHAGLRDRLFKCAPGEWKLYRCRGCGTGYLDPRPNRQTIGLAYASYFTHVCAGGPVEKPGSWWRRFRTAQRNAYLNAHYGYQLTPARPRSPRWLSTGRRLRFDKYTGYLRYPGPGARLLDVGCGNGLFLLQMRSLGWDVFGVEPDPKSAAAAAAAGLNVRSGLLEAQPLPDAHFDAITMNHVVEHLHQPRETLRFCRRILKPGGTLYVATPNLGGAGHRRFGGDWFPLDPPRHLVLFTPESLKRIFASTGFDPEPAVRLRLAAREMFKRSALLRMGRDPMGQGPGLPAIHRLLWMWRAWRADRATRGDPDLTEELVLLARRPETR